MSPDPQTLLERALLAACQLHHGQARKGTNVPYIAHLLAVCSLVLEDGGDEEEATAALLHDALEDQPERITREQVGRRFGKSVLRMVEACTDTEPGYSGGDKGAWLPRKRRYLAHLSGSKDLGYLRVSLADKVHNARSLVADYLRVGDTLWDRFETDDLGREGRRASVLWYYRELAVAFRAAGCEGPLMREFEVVASKLPDLHT